jgi:pimeloyl-ACP methyl ester carboxylesterase
MNKLLNQSTVSVWSRLITRVLLPACVALLVASCATTPTAPEQSSRAIPGYLDYSYDKNSVLFNTADRHMQTVFFDTFYPFDPSLRYNNAEAMVRYELEYKPFSQNGVLMVALADLRKIYAPYFSYTIDPATQQFTVQHHFFRKRVAAGSGSRAPRIEYTKVAWQGGYALASTAATVSSTTHATTTNRNTIDASAAVSSTAPTAVTLEIAPVQRDGRIYVPVASFMRSLGKTITNDVSASGYLAVSHVGAADTADDLFNPKYTGVYPNTPITPGRVKTMNGLLSGEIRTGNLWLAYYFGDINVFSGKVDADGKDINTLMPVDRILPYRLYVPKKYDANVPSKFTFMLHGGTGNENAPFERPNDHLKNQPSPIPGVVTFEDYADHYNYIVLSPNGWTRNPVWGSGPGEQAMLHTLDIVKRRYNIDTERMFIFGNSAGGAGSMNFVLRHGRLFKAMAPTAPGGSKPFAAELKGVILDMPTLLSCFTADITVFYADTAKNSCQPWYQENVKNTMRNVTLVSVDNGHHSYGPASAYQTTFEFFERVLDKRRPANISSVRFSAGKNTATVSAAGGAASTVQLGSAPLNKGGILTVALDDLAKIYGAADFRVYDVYAYNRTPSDLVAVKTVIYNKIAVNIKPGERFLRIGGAIHANDTTGLTTKVAADDPRIDKRTLSVAAQNINGKIHVPVVEFMQLFGKTVAVD